MPREECCPTRLLDQFDAFCNIIMMPLKSFDYCYLREYSDIAWRLFKTFFLLIFVKVCFIFNSINSWKLISEVWKCWKCFKSMCYILNCIVVHFLIKGWIFHCLLCLNSLSFCSFTVLFQWLSASWIWYSYPATTGAPTLLFKAG